MPHISLILGSTRQARFGDKPANWIHGLLQKRTEFTSQLLDLRDYPMPFFDEAIPPARKSEPFKNATVEKWSAELAKADGFIVVTPEYNHGPPGVLKNAFDYAGREWFRKPVAFVGYGNAGGARAIEQLRMVAIELQMAPVKPAIAVPVAAIMAARQGQPIAELLAASDAAANAMIDDLLWWTNALKAARG